VEFFSGIFFSHFAQGGSFKEFPGVLDFQEFFSKI
jgi:hypothetical protein